ncbi:MAG: Superoxide dismutase [Mn] [Chlamydiae bacterium]|nr:Superoxide dismutase [Mn] [Chlamydiota bacterium]
MQDFTPYDQEELPYDFGALEPVISGEIMQLHYEKHHKGYVNGLNAALEKYFNASSEMDLQTMIALQRTIKFTGGGHINHSIFWTNLAPEGNGGGGEPEGDLAIAINKEFGSFQKFVEMFNAQTAPIQGSGWGWLGFCPKEKIVVMTTCQNQDPLSTKGLIPLLGVDVWEHAYYLQYKNLRPEYLKNIWRVVNWGNVAERYAKAASGS